MDQQEYFEDYNNMYQQEEPCEVINEDEYYESLEVPSDEEQYGENS